MTAVPERITMSVEEYLQFCREHPEARYEYLDGHVRMLAGGTANHSRIGVNIVGLLDTLLSDSPCFVYNSDLKVLVSENRFFFPDASVSCSPDDQGDTDTIESPRLIVEILSPGTEAFDRGHKFACYRACPTIQEYVLVNVAYPSVEVCRRQKNDLWLLQVFGPGSEIELTSTNARFPISVVYKNVRFPNNTVPPA